VRVLPRWNEILDKADDRLSFILNQIHAFLKCN